MKILVVRFSSIGDIVLTTPVVRTLYHQLKDVEIHYATKAHYFSILEANPYVHKIHLLDDSFKDLVRRLRQERFDYIIDLHNNLRTLRLKLALWNVPSFSFNKLNLEKWIYVNFKINLMPKIHVVDRYMKTVEPLGVKMDLEGLDYFIPERDEVEKEWLPEDFRENYVVFAIGGQHATKRLPLLKMIELCFKINRPIILLGGKEDMANGELIEKFFMHHQTEGIPEELVQMRSSYKKTKIFNGCGKFNINQSASLIRDALVVFTHDTGMMHIAAAFKKRIYSIWGNTTPDFGMYPYRTRFTVLENNNLKCRPCSKIGYDKCPKGHFKCMNELVFNFYMNTSE